MVNFFSSWKGEGEFFVQLVAAKVNRHHMILFILSYFLCNNFKNKKNMIVFVHKNWYKMAKCYTSLAFLLWFCCYWQRKSCIFLPWFHFTGNMTKWDDLRMWTFQIFRLNGWLYIVYARKIGKQAPFPSEGVYLR